MRTLLNVLYNLFSTQIMYIHRLFRTVDNYFPGLLDRGVYQILNAYPPPPIRRYIFSFLPHYTTIFLVDIFYVVIQLGICTYTLDQLGGKYAFFRHIFSPNVIYIYIYIFFQWTNKKIFTPIHGRNANTLLKQ